MNRIIFSGGGTLGSVIPILSIATELRKIGEFEIYWIGTYKGPEKELIKKYQLKYIPIFSGKLRRYFSIKNFFDVFKFFIGIFQAFFVLIKLKPKCIVTCGSFVSVPLVISGKFLKIKILVHQQDVEIGLANKIMMHFADIITFALKEHQEKLKKYEKKLCFTSNPYRKDFLNVNIEQAFSYMKLTLNLPVILCLGGGTGALSLNKLIFDSLPDLTKFAQIIHITGRGKSPGTFINKNYIQFEFLHNKLKYAYKLSDIVVSRAGMSTLTELSILSKPAILIPIPNSHQEKNAEYFKSKNACIFLSQKNLTKDIFIKTIKNLLFDNQLKFELSKNIGKIIQKDSNKKFINVILRLVQNYEIKKRKF